MRAIDQVLALRDVEAYGTYSSEIVKTPKISRARLAKIHLLSTIAPNQKVTAYLHNMVYNLALVNTDPDLSYHTPDDAI